ncbi:MAG TPA: class I SAM-dependent methyltransferase, partial [Candidatus Nitrosotenuis sp.]|nr:class I SAM-dependent methyltransferase [Candidatus Nitrosotenuis sp.]
ESNYNEEMAKFSRDLAISLRASSVLEIGCSSGNDLKLFPKDSDVNGIDQSDFAIGLAQKNLDSFKFKVASPTSIPYDDSSFDFVFTRNLLNYVENIDVEKTLNEMYRVSKKYILNIERFTPNEQPLDDEPVSSWGRNIQNRWMNFKVKIISNVDMHEEIDPKKSRFTLVRKI